MLATGHRQWDESTKQKYAYMYLQMMGHPYFPRQICLKVYSLRKGPDNATTNTKLFKNLN